MQVFDAIHEFTLNVFNFTKSSTFSRRIFDDLRKFTEKAFFDALYYYYFKYNNLGFNLNSIDPAS